MKRWMTWLVLISVVGGSIFFFGARDSSLAWGQEGECGVDEDGNPNLLTIYHAWDPSAPIPYDREYGPGAFTTVNTDEMDRTERAYVLLEVCKPEDAREDVTLEIREGEQKIELHKQTQDGKLLTAEELEKETFDTLTPLWCEAKEPSQIGGIVICAKTGSEPEKQCEDWVSLTALQLDLDARWPGTIGAPGTLTDDAEEDEPLKLFLFVNDDDDNLDDIIDNNREQSPDIASEDDDLMTVIVRRFDPLIGALEFSTSPELRVFTMDKHTEVGSPLTVDFANPPNPSNWDQVPLAGVMDGDLSFLVEADTISEDAVIKLIYRQGEREASRDEVHLTIVNAGFVEHDKTLVVDTWDVDDDSVPNFADGIQTSQFETADTPAGGSFAPLILELLPNPKDWEHARVKFFYDASDPEQIVQAGEGTVDNPFVYSLPDQGHLRLWTKDGNAVRQIATDYIKSGETYLVSDLLAGDGRTIRLYAEGVKASPMNDDLRRIRVDIDFTGEGQFMEDVDAVRMTVAAAVEDITMYSPESESFEEPLEWTDVIFRDEPVRVKITLSVEIPSLELFQEKSALRIFSEEIEENWRTLTFNEQNTTEFVNVEGRTEIRMTLTWEELIDLELMTQDPTSDGVIEFASLDWIEEPGKSNHNDGNMFDTLMEGNGYKRRGKARGIKNLYNGDETTLESSANKDFMKAGGVQFVQFRALRIASSANDYIESPPRQLQNQANYLYYSGHGSHQEGTLLNAGKLSPAEAEQYWSQEVDTVIIAGCSVLDIKDYSEKWFWHDKFGPARALASPGEKWAKTGPKLLLGYAYTAPLDVTRNEPKDPSDDDPDGTAKIIQLWVEKGMTAKAWMSANEQVMNKFGTQIGVNASAIDLTKKPWTYYFFKWSPVLKGFKNSGIGIDMERKYTIEKKHYDHINHEWPVLDWLPTETP